MGWCRSGCVRVRRFCKRRDRKKNRVKNRGRNQERPRRRSLLPSRAQRRSSLGSPVDRRPGQIRHSSCGLARGRARGGDGARERGRWAVGKGCVSVRARRRSFSLFTLFTYARGHVTRRAPAQPDPRARGPRPGLLPVPRCGPLPHRRIAGREMGGHNDGECTPALARRCVCHRRAGPLCQAGGRAVRCVQWSGVLPGSCRG